MSDQMEKSTAVQELDSSTTHEDLMPTPPEKRTITSVTFFVMCVGMYVQLLSFINGAQLYPGLSPKMIIFACLAGNGLVWLLLTLTGDIGIKHGLPYAIYLRAPFGYKGSQAPGLVPVSYTHLMFRFHADVFRFEGIIRDIFAQFFRDRALRRDRIGRNHTDPGAFHGFHHRHISIE